MSMHVYPCSPPLTRSHARGFSAQQIFGRVVFVLTFNQGIKKGNDGSLFGPCVNAMGRQPYWPSCMEVSYCTFGFGVIIRCDQRTLSLPCDSPHDNLYACKI